MKFFLFIFLSIFSTLKTWAIDLEFVKLRLAGEGLVVEVHGSVDDQQMLVVTVRDPDNFFHFEHFSAIGKSADVQSQLLARKRHDKIILRGALIENRSKQGHIEVASFELKEEYKNPHNPGDYPYDAQIPEELIGKNSAEFLVHAVHKEGEVLVLEYKDRVLPIFVRADQAHFSKDLARNDLIRAHFQIARNPHAPVHLKLNPEILKPIEVLQSVMPMHGQSADVTGELVLFPKSPQVSFDIFAILQPIEFGLKRNFTLINFDDPELFKKIREKCAQAWATAPNDFVNGRNKLVHKTIKFRAKGIFNQVDANQANVQILIQNINDLEWVKP